MASDSAVDVLIIGAGPAGAMCAFNLSQAGLTVRIVDQKKERLLKGQGDYLQIRGLEILDSIELAEPVLREAHRSFYFNTYKGDSDHKIARVSRRDIHAGVHSRFRHDSAYPQIHIERNFRDAMGSGDRIIRSLTVRPQFGAEIFTPRKVVVEQGTRPTRLVIDSSESGPVDYPVSISLKHPDGKTETVKAKYLIGCDGAHSWTRAQLGISMVGDTSNDVWGVVDGWIDTDFPDVRHLCVVENNGRRAVLVPREEDMVRFTVKIEDGDANIDPVTGRVDRTRVQLQKIQQLVQEAFHPNQIEFVGEPDWWGVYVVGQRLATAYEGGHGRVFIVGDACHTHSPHAGQGMNAAISDGHNLSWKLVHVLKGWAGTELLHTYESERRWFAEELMQLHERIAKVMSGKIPGNNADEMAKSAGFVCGTTIQYPPSRIVDATYQHLAPGVRIGQRLPHQVILRTSDCRPHSTHDLLKSDFRYKLLVFTGNAKDADQLEMVAKLSEDIFHWLAKTDGSSTNNVMVQVYTIMHSKKEISQYTDIPKKLRSHWDTVFMDDVALTETDGGGTTYQSFGIGPEGCIVVARPDGHVAAIAPLLGVEILKHFFGRI
ncbi:hypothetical protein BDV93DRAFT_497033, partial [Ceratobasidium sp. AG-I]